MRELLLSRTTAIWFLLVAATLLSWEMGHGVGFQDLRHAGVAILIIAFIKVRFVVLEFMEVRHAPIVLRVLTEAWSVVVCALLVTMFALAPAAA